MIFAIPLKNQIVLGNHSFKTEYMYLNEQYVKLFCNPVT